MSAGTLRVIYVGVLSVTALWPVAQWYLVEKHDVNPWKLCGFAMYCTPHHVSLDVVDTTDGRLEIGVQNGPTSGARSACKMDPPYRTREGTGEFASGFKGQGCLRWTITDGFGELIVTA